MSRPKLAAVPESSMSLAHRGAFTARVDAGDVAVVTPLAGETDPSPLLNNLPGAIRYRSRVTGPALRRG